MVWEKDKEELIETWCPLHMGVTGQPPLPMAERRLETFGLCRDPSVEKFAGSSV